MFQLASFSFHGFCFLLTLREVINEATMFQNVFLISDLICPRGSMWTKFHLSTSWMENWWFLSLNWPRRLIKMNPKLRLHPHTKRKHWLMVLWLKCPVREKHLVLGKEWCPKIVGLIYANYWLLLKASPETTMGLLIYSQMDLSDTFWYFCSDIYYQI